FAAVHIEHGLHRVAETRQRLTAVRPLGVAATVPCIDLPFRTQEKDDEGQVIIEFKEIQVVVLDPRQPDADKLVSEVADLFETENLPVKLLASYSGDAAEHHHEWLAGLPGLRLAGIEARQPAEVGGLIAPRPARLSGGRAIADYQEAERKEQEGATGHEQ